jgi:cytochrome c-type biogenesis protein CcmH
LKFARNLSLAFLLVMTSLSYGADRERVKDLSSKLMCMCGGCNAVLGFCPHSVTCPTGVPMKTEIEKMLDEGRDEKSILDHFVTKYGTNVLSAPTTTGFNLTAWIMPYVALGIGAILAVYFVRRFRAGAPQTALQAGGDTAKYKSRVEEELEKYTPED